MHVLCTPQDHSPHARLAHCPGRPGLHQWDELMEQSSYWALDQVQTVHHLR